MDRMKLLSNTFEYYYGEVKQCNEKIKDNLELYDKLRTLDVDRSFPDYEDYRKNEYYKEEIENAKVRFLNNMGSFSKEEITNFCNLVRSGEIIPIFRDEPWFKNGFLGLSS